MKIQPPRLYSFGRFQLNTAECTLLRDGQPVMLEPKVSLAAAVTIATGAAIYRFRLR